MAETEFTFKDASGTTKTALAGANGSNKLAPAAVLYALDGTQLIGQKARAASLPVTLSAEDMTALTPVAGGATASNQATQITALADILTKLSADPATQTTLAAILAKIIASPATEAKQDALAALIGEVQASPTANTVLDRLKAVSTALAGTLAVSGTFWQATQPVSIATLPTLAAGTNNIGDVDVLSLPALAAGTNNIGDVDVLTLPALPAGTNAIGKLAANSGVDIGDVDVTSISAGENHLGEVGGSSLTVTPTHTVDTAVYAAGDTVGTIITIANAFRASGKESILQSIHILDRSNQKPTGNLLFFNASPAAATTTDNAAFVYSTDDLKEVARVPIVSADYTTINSKAVANLSNLGRQVYATTGTSLYVVFVTDGAPDFVATTDLQISYSFLRD